jgi:hypothetical protein
MTLDYTSLNALLTNIPATKDIHSARAELREQFDALTLIGKLVSQNDHSLFVASDNHEVWEVPKQGVIGVTEAEDDLKHIAGASVALLVRNGTRVIMQREYEVGKDIIASLPKRPRPCQEPNTADREGLEPSTNASG